MPENLTPNFNILLFIVNRGIDFYPLGANSSLYSSLIVIYFEIIRIPESFNSNKISHQLFDYRITFVNSQHQKTNSKGDFVLKNRF